MATGEMAAIIAHGFRNSLTSIKMILQLQQESKHQQPSTRTSLKVALESIPTNGVSRPGASQLRHARQPMVFRLGDLNSLVEQGLALLGFAPEPDNIAVKKSPESEKIPRWCSMARTSASDRGISPQCDSGGSRDSPRRTAGKKPYHHVEADALAKTLRDYHFSGDEPE